MSEKAYILNVYNTMTGECELVQVTKEVFDTYRRTGWNAKYHTRRSSSRETRMSALIGGENGGYERFHEFIDYEDTPENAVIEESDADGFIKPVQSLSEKLSLATSYSFFYRDIESKRFID